MKNSNRQKGFSLIMMAIVLIITGLIMAGIAASLNLHLKNKAISDTQKHITEVQNALQNYVATNNRLPCPSSLTAAATAAVEGAPAAGANCAAAGVTIVPGANPVIIGAVPFRALNIPREMTFDGWGNRLTYAVTRKLLPAANGGTEDINASTVGAITYLDEKGVTYAGNTHALISHGRVGRGAYNASGTLVLPCNVGTTEGDNCDWQNAATSPANAIHFTSVPYVSSELAAGFTDDISVISKINSAQPPGSLYDFFPTCGVNQKLQNTGSRLECRNLPAVNIVSCPQGFLARITNGAPTCTPDPILYVTGGPGGVGYTTVNSGSIWCNWGSHRASPFVSGISVNGNPGTVTVNSEADVCNPAVNPIFTNYQTNWTPVQRQNYRNNNGGQPPPRHICEKAPATGIRGISYSTTTGCYSLGFQ